MGCACHRRQLNLRLDNPITSLEPVTHFLFGANLGRAGLNRKTALATATLTLAAEAADLDVFSLFGGPAFGLNHHRGFTHSILGVPIVASIVVAFVYLIWRLRRRPIKNPALPPRWSVLFLFACLAGLSHILLDFTNNYGIRPWWPFSERWISWDIVFIVDPVILLALVLGLVVPGLFSLVNEEIGAKQKGPPGRVAATIALIVVVTWWGLRNYEHTRAVAALEARSYQSSYALRASAYPYRINPFRWHGVVEAPAFFATTDVDSLTPEVDPDNTMRIHFKPEETPVTLAAKASYLGRVFLSWAQYPITETEELASNPADNSQAAYVVRLRDLRYAYPRQDSSRTMLGARVFLTHDLQVVAEEMGVRSAPSRQK